MKTMLKISVLASAAVLMFIADMRPEMPVPYVQFVPEAHAILGVRRRTAVVAASSAHAADSAQIAQAQQQTAAAQQQAAAAKQETAAAQQQAASAQQQAAAAQQQAAAARQEAEAAKLAAAAPPVPAAAPGKPLPIGTVVAALPGGCVATPVGGKEYYYCGGNFYRAAFQGNNLVYVTAQPK